MKSLTVPEVNQIRKTLNELEDALRGCLTSATHIEVDLSEFDDETITAQVEYGNGAMEFTEIKKFNRKTMQLIEEDENV